MAQHHRKWRRDFAAQLKKSSCTGRAKIIATCYSNEYLISGQVVKIWPPPVLKSCLRRCCGCDGDIRHGGRRDGDDTCNDKMLCDP